MGLAREIFSSGCGPRLRNYVLKLPINVLTRNAFIFSLCLLHCLAHSFIVLNQFIYYKPVFGAGGRRKAVLATKKLLAFALAKKKKNGKGACSG